MSIKYTKKEKVHTKDGEILQKVVYTPNSKEKAIIFMNHGITIPKEGPFNILADLAITLCENGYKVIAYDFRGHGESSGNSYDVSIETGLIDIDAIVKSEDIHNKAIGMFGFSYGAGISMLYAKNMPSIPKAMVFFSPAWEFNECLLLNKNSILTQDYKKALESGSLDKDNYFIFEKNNFKVGRHFIEKSNLYEPYNELKKINTHVLTLQAKNDIILSCEVSKKYGQNISEQFIELNASHPLIEEKEKAFNYTVNWFNQYLK